MPNNWTRQEENKQVRTLNRCGITDVDRSSMVGRFKNFLFRFQNYYWIVEGSVPILVANQMFKHPIGKTDIRVGGHCGCLDPMDYGIKWTSADGREVIKTSEEIDFKKFEYLGGDWLPEIVQAKYIFHDSPESIGAIATVNHYHIDSELGLYIFMMHVQRLGD